MLKRLMKILFVSFMIFPHAVVSALTLGAGDTIAFDTTAGTYKINGGSDVYGVINGKTVTYKFSGDGLLYHLGLYHHSDGNAPGRK